MARRPRKRTREMLELSLATGIGQALAGWAAEYTHTLLERNPDLRQKLRANWIAMYEEIARMNNAEQPRRKAPRPTSRR